MTVSEKDEFKRDREVIDTATGGSWTVDYEVNMPGSERTCATCHTVYIAKSRQHIGDRSFPDKDLTEDDAQFIARARTRWPAALDELARLQFGHEQLCKSVDAKNVEIDALRHCVERWQSGGLIESDLVCRDGRIAKDPYAEIERLREALVEISGGPDYHQQECRLYTRAGASRYCSCESGQARKVLEGKAND